MQSRSWMATAARLSAAAKANSWRLIETIDMHTAGEPVRLVFAEDIVGDDVAGRHQGVLSLRRELQARHDDVRRVLMLEPRGHADMYGCVVTPPNDDGALCGAIFTHCEGYSTMCGHATMALAVLAVQGVWTESSEVIIDAPCGRLTVAVDGTTARVRNVPAFVVDLDATVDVPGLGSVTYDLAYGGAFYAYVRTEMNLAPTNAAQLVDVGRRIKAAVASRRSIVHPFEADLSFLYGTIFVGPPSTDDVHSKNVCVFADGQIDRSPTGSGLAGRVAVERARGNMKQAGDSIVVESIIGTRFTATLHDADVTYGPYTDAVIADVAGDAYVTGIHSFVRQPGDPFPDGFRLC